MKNIELFQAAGELDDDLLLDAEEFLKGPKKPKSRPWVKWGGLAACAALAACALWVMSPGEGQRPQDATPPPEIVRTPNVDPPVIESEPVNKPFVSMYFNQLTGEPEQSTTAMFALMGEDFVPMPREELLDYFGVTLPVEEVLPAYFAVGPEEGDGFGRGIYRSESRDTYFDTNTFSFEHTGGVIGVYVTLDKAFHMAAAPWELPGDLLEFTTINGWELALFRYPDEEGNQYFYTEFLQNDVGYRVCGKNMREQEYAAVLGALLEQREAPAPSEPRTFTGEYGGGIGYQTLTATNPDGSVTVEESRHGPLHLDLDGGSEYPSLRIELTPEQAEEFSDLSLGDRVEVTFTGEPASIGTVWTQQLVSLKRAEE